MKTAGLQGILCLSVVLALNGGQTAWGEEAQSPVDAASEAAVPAAGDTGLSGAVLPDDIEPNSAFAELVRLAQAGVEESVLLAYIDNTLRLFELDADDIIYLTDLGVPAEVIKAAMEHDQQLIEEGISPEAKAADSGSPAETVEDPSVPPEEVSTEVFYDTLSPYGTWVHIDGYGRCWRPSVVVYHTTWHPYGDNGRWIYTDHGWYWRSGYSWGWAPFHYGRWFRHARYGWCWWPDTVWAPSWVFWRYDRSYCGWAPLPPYTHYRSGVGFVYRGDRVSAGFDFGLSADTFTFVAVEDFYDSKPRNRRVDKAEASRIYTRTTPFHKINYDRRQGKISNAGIPKSDVARAARREIRPVSISQVQNRGVRGRPERVERGDRTHNRPQQTPSGNSAPAARRADVQRSYRAERQDESATQRGVSQGSRRERTYQRPQPRQNPPSQARQNPSPRTRQTPPAQVRQSPSPQTRQNPPSQVRQNPSPRARQSPSPQTRQSPSPQTRQNPPSQVRQNPSPRTRQSPPPQARQSPPSQAAPRQRERYEPAAPRGSGSYRSSQRTAQNNRSKPAPAVNASRGEAQPAQPPQANPSASRRPNENAARGAGAAKSNRRAP